MKSVIQIIAGFMILSVGITLAGCGLSFLRLENTSQVPIPGCSIEQDDTIIPEMLSAFYGLADAPAFVYLNAGLCTEDGLPIGLLDGMPIVMSVLIDSRSIDTTDFRITTVGGATSTPVCAMLEPADDECEGRTIAIFGEFGSAEDPPTRVEIVGELLSLDGRDVSQTATPIDVTPLVEGPTLVLVEQVDPIAVGAPADTEIAVRAVWGGGIVAVGRNELSEAEWGLYALTIADDQGNEMVVAPFAVGDLDDGDNNHLLFFNIAGEPLTLSLTAGLVIDPNGDINPLTEQTVLH